MIQALLPSLLPAVTDIVGRFLPEDREARAKAEREIEAQLTAHLAKVDLGQMEINKVEAASRSVWVSGWRPAVGWCCVTAMSLNFVVFPLASFVLAQSGYLVDLPTLDMSEMMPVLMGLLGLGGLRTVEKIKQVSK